MRILAAMTLSLLVVPLSIGMAADDEETQQLHNNPYQQYISTTCQYQGDCAVVFPATTKITTVITNVSCQFAIPSGTSILSAAVLTQEFGARFFVQPFYFGYAEGSATYGINSATNLFVNKGVQPRIDVYSTGGAVSNMFCTISGYHS
jgi:electron transfer flavoprotein alpha subunit